MLLGKLFESARKMFKNIADALEHSSPLTKAALLELIGHERDVHE